MRLDQDKLRHLTQNVLRRGRRSDVTHDIGTTPRQEYYPNDRRDIDRFHVQERLTNFHNLTTLGTISLISPNHVDEYLFPF